MSYSHLIIHSPVKLLNKVTVEYSDNVEGEVGYKSNPELYRKFIDAAKSYSSGVNCLVTINDPRKYKSFRDGQDSAWQILKEENKRLLEANKELIKNLIRVVDRIKENDLSEYMPSAYDRAKAAIQKHSTK